MLLLHIHWLQETPRKRKLRRVVIVPQKDRKPTPHRYKSELTLGVVSCGLTPVCTWVGLWAANYASLQNSSEVTRWVGFWAAKSGLTLVFSSSGTVWAAMCGLTLVEVSGTIIRDAYRGLGGQEWTYAPQACIHRPQPTVPKLARQPTSEKIGASCSRACQVYLNNSRRIPKFTSCGMFSWHSRTCLMRTALHVPLSCTSLSYSSIATHLQPPTCCSHHGWHEEDAIQTSKGQLKASML